MKNNDYQIPTRPLLGGHDPLGKVYDYGDKIIRQIEPLCFDQVSHIYILYLKHKLSSVGLVNTTINRRKKQLIHKKHVISYPHEWTYSMFKDSILFQLKLVQKLDHYGLTLKDFLPNNVVYNYSNPIFVDFLSLISKGELRKEKWLYVGVANQDISPHKLLISKMFTPYLLIPLFIYAKKNYSSGRTILETKVCNLGNGMPTWGDVILGGTWKLDSLLLATKSIWLNIFSRGKYLDIIKKYIDIVNTLDVRDSHSAYLTYYQAKGEEYSLKSQKLWKKKQKNIYQIIHSLKPKTTLDIGANTGWYSSLAEREGSTVIATDVDEGTIDALYQNVKKFGLKILPLVLPFSAFIKPSNTKAYLPTITRFRSDLVMCLALIHHLVLGQGESVEKIIDVLASLSKKVVILEFVDINDEKIQEDPSFFPQIEGPASRMYKLDIVVEIAKKYFSKIDIMDSTESSRKLLILYH